MQPDINYYSSNQIFWVCVNHHIYCESPHLLCEPILLQGSNYLNPALVAVNAVFLPTLFLHKGLCIISMQSSFYALCVFDFCLLGAYFLLFLWGFS